MISGFRKGSPFKAPAWKYTYTHLSLHRRRTSLEIKLCWTKRQFPSTHSIQNYFDHLYNVLVKWRNILILNVCKLKHRKTNWLTKMIRQSGRDSAHDLSHQTGHNWGLTASGTGPRALWEKKVTWNCLLQWRFLIHNLNKPNLTFGEYFHFCGGAALLHTNTFPMPEAFWKELKYLAEHENKLCAWSH